MLKNEIIIIILEINRLILVFEISKIVNGKHRIKPGNENFTKSDVKFLIFVFFDITICVKLTTLEIGKTIESVSENVYPNNKNDGVPNTNKPIPKID